MKKILILVVIISTGASADELAELLDCAQGPIDYITSSPDCLKPNQTGSRKTPYSLYNLPELAVQFALSFFLLPGLPVPIDGLNLTCNPGPAVNYAKLYCKTT